MTYEELKAVNAAIVEEALRDLGQDNPYKERIGRIARICEDGIRKNEGLKQRVRNRPDHLQVWQAIDARILPLKEILAVTKEGT